jgi:hypothetical protein
MYGKLSITYLDSYFFGGIWNVCGNDFRMNYFLVLDPYLSMIVFNLIFVGMLSVTEPSKL